MPSRRTQKSRYKFPYQSNKYPLSHNSKNKEETIIRTILNNNNYPQNTIQEILKPSEKNNTKRKCTIFTFFRPEIRTITKLYKNTEVGILYITKNNIKHLLRINENTVQTKSIT
jgi:hypothetical protein